MKTTATPPVPVWLFYERHARDAYARFDARNLADRLRAQRQFHASFRRLA